MFSSKHFENILPNFSTGSPCTFLAKARHDDDWAKERRTILREWGEKREARLQFPLIAMFIFCLTFFVSYSWFVSMSLLFDVLKCF